MSDYIDYIKALDLSENRQINALISDKGYEVYYTIEAARNVGLQVVPLSKAIYKITRDYAQELYKKHNLV